MMDLLGHNSIISQRAFVVVGTPLIQLNYVMISILSRDYLSLGNSMRWAFPLEKPHCFNQWIMPTCKFNDLPTHQRRW